MCNLAILTNNYVDSADLSIITGTPNAQFPLENIKEPFTTKVFRAGGNTIQVLVDLTQTRTIDTFAITGNALTGLGFTTVSIAGSGSTDFTSATEIPITVNSEYNFGFNFFTAVDYRFWRITINTTTSGDISNIYLGERKELTENGISQSSLQYSVSDNSTVSNNRYGQSFINTYNRIKTISGEIQLCNNAEFELLEDIWTYHGRNRPVWFILDPNGTSVTNGEYIFSMFCYIDDDFVWSNAGADLYNVSLSLRQVI